MMPAAAASGIDSPGLLAGKRSSPVPAAAAANATSGMWSTSMTRRARPTPGCGKVGTPTTPVWAATRSPTSRGRRLVEPDAHADCSRPAGAELDGPSISAAPQNRGNSGSKLAPRRLVGRGEDGVVPDNDARDDARRVKDRQAGLQLCPNRGLLEPRN